MTGNLRFRRVSTVVALGAVTVTLAACSQTSAATNPAADDLSAGVPAAAPTAALVVATGHRTLAQGATVPAGSTLDVSVARGRLLDSRLTDEAGRRLPLTAPLPPHRSYALTAKVEDRAGTRTLTREIATRRAPRRLEATLTPGDGATVGVGQPVIVDFDHPVSDRASAERALHVTTSKPVGPASWSWLSDTQVQYRPHAFWPAYTNVVVTADLRDVQTGSRTWGVRDYSTTFTVGRAQVLRIHNHSLRLKVVRNGHVIRRMGVSMGKSGYTTRSGTKVIMTQELSRRMSSDTVNIGGSESYDLDVPYSMRITNSGEFLHGAPWNPLVGSANVSHGCTNLDLSEAKWLFHHSLLGDPVVTRGTGRPMEPDNGWGGAWNVPWKDWVADSALS